MRCHDIKKDEMEGIVVKIAIIVPLTKISSDPFLNTLNNLIEQNW